MKRQYSITLVAISTLLLNGCMHLSKEQCLGTNWQQVGYNDGIAGNAPNDLAREIKDCQEHHVTVDTNAYRQGWQAGLKVFCSPTAEQGKSDGSNGAPYSNILNRNSRCLSGSIPLKLTQYKAGYNAGIQLYCSYDNGYTIGLQGNQPPEVCTGSLKQRFIGGWEAGARKFCGNMANAYALGKEGKPYPLACPATAYYAFKAEYDRGAILRQKLNDVQSQVDDINRTINNLVFRYRLRNTYDARGYELGENRSPEAIRALRDVKELLYRRMAIEGQRNQLEVTR